MTKKLKSRVMVGAIVKEYEDEREKRQFLQREQDRTNRSWVSLALISFPETGYARVTSVSNINRDYMLTCA